MTETFTCISKNIVYCIICKQCNIIYIGEKGRRLADRITEHLHSNQNNFSGFSVAQNVSPPSHFTLIDFYVTGIIHCLLFTEQLPDLLDYVNNLPGFVCLVGDINIHFDNHYNH